MHSRGSSANWGREKPFHEVLCLVWNLLHELADIFKDRGSCLEVEGLDERDKRYGERFQLICTLELLESFQQVE
jgi:hypothetical protein